MANATWAWHQNRLDTIYRFVAAGSTTEPQIMPDGRNGPMHAEGLHLSNAPAPVIPQP